MRRLAPVMFILLLSRHGYSQGPIVILDVTSQNQEAGPPRPGGGAAGPAGWLPGFLGGTQPVTETGFLQLVEDGERALGRFLGRRRLDLGDADLAKARHCFKAAIGLRSKGLVNRGSAGSRLYLPDLEIAVINYYKGLRGPARSALEPVLSQGFPAGMGLLDRGAILAQMAKARYLRSRLDSPFLPGYAPIQQRTSNSCGPTTICEQIAGMGGKPDLATGEALRANGSGSLDEIAAIGRTLGKAAGIELDSVTSDHTAGTGKDPEVAFIGGIGVEGLRNLLVRGYPVVVSGRDYVKPGQSFPSWANGHYFLLIGAKSDAGGRVEFLYTADPGEGVYRRITRANFEGAYGRNGRGAILLVPRSPARRFRCRLSVEPIFGSRAERIDWH